MNEEERCEMFAVFEGRVQGVGFRYTAQTYGLQLSLTGTVKNLSDGTVEVKAQGAKKNLQLFLAHIEEAFPASHIKTISFQKPNHAYTTFDILR